MKRKTLEMLVLIIGVIIIGTALTLMFTQQTNPQIIFITNMVFALGFLVYIVYNIMSTNSLNREIRSLNAHIEGLKEELNKKEETLKSREEELDSQKEKVEELQNKLQNAEAEYKTLNEKLEQSSNKQS